MAPVTPNSWQLRPATAADVPGILKLIHELAAYEREADAVRVTADDLLREGFGEHPLFHGLLGEIEGKLAGFAFYFFNYSTWQGRPGLYLEDLFVRPDHRGLGLGRGLMQALAQIAVERGCGRFSWQVLDWNSDAISFYQQLGAEVLREWLTVRMSGDALHALARRS